MEQELLNLISYSKQQTDTNSTFTNLMSITKENSDKFNDLLKSANDNLNKKDLNSMSKDLNSQANMSSKNKNTQNSQEFAMADKNKIKTDKKDNLKTESKENTSAQKDTETKDVGEKVSSKTQKEANVAETTNQKSSEMNVESDLTSLSKETLDLMSEFELENAESSTNLLQPQEIAIKDMVLNTDKTIKSFYDAELNLSEVEVEDLNVDVLNLETVDTETANVVDISAVDFKNVTEDLDELAEEDLNTEDVKAENIKVEDESVKTKNIVDELTSEKTVENVDVAKNEQPVIALDSKDMLNKDNLKEKNSSAESNMQTVKSSEEVTNVEANTKDQLDQKAESKKVENNTELNKKEDTLVKDGVETDFQEEKPEEYMVKVADDVADSASEISKPDKFEKAKEALKKAGLGGEEFGDLNVTVNSVEDGSTDFGNGGNYFAQRDGMQEQLMRATLQNNSNSASSELKVDMAQALDKSSAKDFVKTQTTQATKASQTADLPKEPSKAEILNQVQDKIQAMNKNGVSKIQMALTPEKLGKVNIEIVQTKEGVSAKFIAETAQVKEILEKNLETLKSNLASQGVNVNSVTVKVAGASNSSNTSNESFSQERHDEFAGNSQGNSSNSSEFGESADGRHQDMEREIEASMSENVLNEIEDNIEKDEVEDVISRVDSITENSILEMEKVDLNV